MNKTFNVPDSQTSKGLLDNLRRARLELDEINLQLETVSALIDQELREQKLKRIQSKLLVFDL